MLDKGLDKAQWLEEIRSARTGWENLLTEISPDKLLEPGAEGSWSVKDVPRSHHFLERSSCSLPGREP